MDILSGLRGILSITKRAIVGAKKKVASVNRLFQDKREFLSDTIYLQLNTIPIRIILIQYINKAR